MFNYFEEYLLAHYNSNGPLLRLFKNITVKAQQMQRIQLASALFKLKPNITAGDRTACALELGISKITICYYLAGRISNNDRAVQVLDFFKTRIEARQQEIDNLCKKL